MGVLSVDSVGLEPVVVMMSKYTVLGTSDFWSESGLYCAFFHNKVEKSKRARQADRYFLAPGDECVYCMYFDTSLTRMRCCRWPLYGSCPVIFGRRGVPAFSKRRGLGYAGRARANTSTRLRFAERR
jgi:hypothetical protein